MNAEQREVIQLKLKKANALLNEADILFQKQVLYNGHQPALLRLFPRHQSVAGYKKHFSKNT